jgi:competence protein ComEC
MPRAGWLAVGALIASQLPTTGALAPASLIVSLALLVAALAVARARRASSVAFLVGAGLVGLRVAGPAVAMPEPPRPPLMADAAGAWTAAVDRIGSTDGGQQRAVLLVDRPEGGVLKAYAWLPRYPIVSAGNRIAFEARLEPPPRDGSGFAEFLVSGGFQATTRPRSFRLASAPAGLPGTVQALRRLADDALARALPEPEAGLASGIVVGRRDRVSSDVADDFTTTGLSHVVAISGWNIALVGAVVGTIVGAVGMPRRGRTVTIVASVVLYTLLAGGGASVVRAAVMGGVALVARETGRPGTAASALGLAIVGLLLVDPAMATDIGFQLSVAATAGLLAWCEPITGRLTARLGSGRGQRWLAESLGVSLAAQAATLPIVLYHFGRLSLISPLANVLIAPLVAPAMLVGVLAVGTGLLAIAGVPAFLVAPITVTGWLVLSAMVGIADVLAAVPLASVTPPPPWDLVLASAAAAAVLGAASRLPGAPTSRTDRSLVPRARPVSVRRQRVRRAAVAGVVVVGVVVGVTAVGVTRSEPRLVLSVMDVGQGDALLLEGPAGTRILVDSGPDPDRLMSVLDGLVPPWDRRIDLAVLTHPHEDHVAGLALLMTRYRVGTVAENGMLGNGPGDHALRELLRSTSIGTVLLAAGDHLDLDGARVDVLWPRRGSVPSRAPSSGTAVNNTTVVFDVRLGVRRLLLMGDVEEEVDPELIGAGIAPADGARLDVLKVAHHGSATATTEALLDELKPRQTLVSAGLGNPYGHPAPRTIERLEEHGANVLRTDLDGTLRVSTDGRDLLIATSGGRPAAAGASSVRSAAAPPGGPRVTWWCAIPAPSLVVTARAAGAGDPHPPRGNFPTGPAEPPAPPAGWVPCYDRARVDPLPCAGGWAAAGSVAFAPPAAALHRRGRGGRVPRRSRASPRCEGGSPHRGGSRAASRPRQGVAPIPPTAQAGPRSRGRPLAGRAWPPRARTGGEEPSRRAVERCRV